MESGVLTRCQVSKLVSIRASEMKFKNKRRESRVRYVGGARVGVGTEFAERLHMTIRPWLQCGSEKICLNRAGIS